MSLFPVFLKLAGQPIVVIGAGALAEAKIEALLETGAKVSTVAPQARPRVVEWADSGRIIWHQRRFEPADVRDKTLVFAATGVPKIDRDVARQCRRDGVLCNAIDDPPFCDFYSPAVVRRGDLQIAISTNGQSPALAQQLRQQLEKQFDATWGERIVALGQQRRQLLSTLPTSERRKQLLHQIARQTMETNVGHWGSGESESADLRDVAVRLAERAKARQLLNINDQVSESGSGAAAEESADSTRSQTAGLLRRAAHAVVDWLSKDEEKVTLI